MMHPLTITSVVVALDALSHSAQLRTALADDSTPENFNLHSGAPPSSLFETKSSATPSSFVQEGSPDSFADLDAKLKQLEDKTKAELAKLQADTAAPSSFVQTGSPDSFADLDAKLKQLEDKTKAELAKLQ